MEFPVGMRVLAVDDNPICLRKLENMLLLCKYHVTKTTDSKKALDMLREKSNMFDMVITDADLPDTDGFKLLEIGVEMGLPVIMLSQHNSKESVVKAVTRGACGYLVKPVGLSELQNIWQHVVTKNINKDASTQQLPPCESHLSPSFSKKHSHRVLWTPELHQKFVNAVEQLGPYRAFPKQIRDLMNVEGLTRENVASHFQKYRICMNKVDHQNPINSQELNNALLPGDVNSDDTSVSKQQPLSSSHCC